MPNCLAMFIPGVLLEGPWALAGTAAMKHESGYHQA